MNETYRVARHCSDFLKSVEHFQHSQSRWGKHRSLVATATLLGYKSIHLRIKKQWGTSEFYYSPSRTLNSREYDTSRDYVQAQYSKIQAKSSEELCH